MMVDVCLASVVLVDGFGHRRSHDEDPRLNQSIMHSFIH
jgi:hypothetical protein